MSMAAGSCSAPEHKVLYIHNDQRLVGADAREARGSRLLPSEGPDR